MYCGGSEFCVPYQLACLQTDLFKPYCLPRLQYLSYFKLTICIVINKYILGYRLKSLIKLHASVVTPQFNNQAFMSLTLAANEKPSTLMGKRCSLLPLSHRVHKDKCFLFKEFFLNHVPPNIRTH